LRDHARLGWGKTRKGEVSSFLREAFMTIEINRPETEALIQQCLERGHFRDVADLLVEALGALREKLEGQKNLVDV